ncbi:hypothetical protein K470DRAFT_216848, partial [Piedraia hortae CBS 480.64]
APEAMLNAKALTELLSKNSDEKLYRRWWLTTANGTLLAYNVPADLRSLRKQVAAAVMLWQDHHLESDASQTNRQAPTMIILSEDCNVLVREIEDDLLLGLEAGVPLRNRGFKTRIIIESQDGNRLHKSNTASDVLGTSTASTANSTISVATSGVLSLHKKKFDAMAAAMLDRFEEIGFKLPEMQYF